MEAKAEHEIADHDLYKGTDTNIAQQTIESLRTTMSRVKYLLERWPATRGDDRVLILMYLRIFEKSLVYNSTTQKIEFRSKDGVTYDEWRSIASFETVTRARRKMQENFPELLPSDATILKRKHKEQAIRGSIKTMAHSNDEYKKVKGDLE